MIRWIPILTLGAIWCCRAQAVGLPHFSIDDAVNSADLILVADVKEVRDLGSALPIQFRNHLLQAKAYSADVASNFGCLPEQLLECAERLET
jgi:hypothetical protein